MVKKITVYSSMSKQSTPLYSILDRLIISFDKLLQKEVAHNIPANPAQNIVDRPSELPVDYQHSAKLMRINHSGEICAQALYHGQALFTRNNYQYQQLMHSAQEELVHLTWCQQRLTELNSRPSYLTALWFAGSYVIGVVASLYGDKYSNGFTYETEQQVSKHLESHLQQLPKFDLRSRAILTQMLVDEQTHALHAKQRGANVLPTALKVTMRYTANIFKHITAII
jgi:ubiquinone biosynthesis monooxygenase Coq7